MKKLLIATKNPGKLAEYQILLRNIPIKLVSLSDLNITEEASEHCKTFNENAIQKAKFYGEISNIVSLADDGGLEIDALNGEPGVKSRRWAGYRMTDQAMIDLALKKMKNIPREKRNAQLRMVIAIHFPDNIKTYTFEGIVSGIISTKAHKKLVKGYPFRSVLYLPEKKKYFCEFSQKEIEQYSQRAYALKKAYPFLKKYL